MVVDARVEVTFKEDRAGAEAVTETLFPSRHQITLPLNNINILFDGCRVAFNQSTALSSDFNSHLDWDGWSHMSTLEQCFNPDREDIFRRQNLGNIKFYIILRKKITFEIAQVIPAGCLGTLKTLH
jgi:hypothetical protein